MLAFTMVVLGCKPPLEVCGDGRDNDQDGRVDCEDADCPCEEDCESPGDEDENGWADCDDAACWGLRGCPVTLNLESGSATLQMSSSFHRQITSSCTHGSYHPMELDFQLHSAAGTVAVGSRACDWRVQRAQIQRSFEPWQRLYGGRITSREWSADCSWFEPEWLPRLGRYQRGNSVGILNLSLDSRQTYRNASTMLHTRWVGWYGGGQTSSSETFDSGCSWFEWSRRVDIHSFEPAEAVWYQGRQYAPSYGAH